MTYTTGEAAKILGVSQHTAIRACDCGALPSYKIPPGQFRYIPRKGLLEFMLANGVPLDGLGELSAEERDMVERKARAA